MAYGGTIAAILSNYSEVLKTFYLPAIQESLNNDTILKAVIETNETDVSGKNATINHHYGRNTGTFAVADGAIFANPGNQQHQTSTVPCKYNYGIVTFSGPTIAATRDSKGSYANVIDNEIRGVVKDVSTEINRQMWGCGYGVIGRWRSGSASSITFQKMYRGNSIGGDGFGSTFGGKYVKENASCAPVLPTFSTVTATAAALGAVDMAVSAVDTTGSSDYDTITCTSASISEAAGVFYVRPKNTVSTTSASAAGLARQEMMGLRGIVTDTNLDNIPYFDSTYDGGQVSFTVEDPLQGLDTDSYDWWKANVDVSSTRYSTQRALTFELMHRMFDKIEVEAGKDYGPDIILTTHALKREYGELCDADRRRVNVMELDGGYSGLEFNGIPLVADKDAIDGEMYFLTTRDLSIYRMSDYDWMDKDGAILSRVANYDAYEAILFRYAELGCKRRNSQGVIGDLAYTAT